MSHDLGMPPEIKEEVVKMDLSSYSVNVPPTPKPQDPWTDVKKTWNGMLDGFLAESEAAHKEIAELTLKNQVLTELLNKQSELGKVFDLAFDEMFGPESFPYVRVAFKQRLGL